jgi:hypothetical protein
MGGACPIGQTARKHHAACVVDERQSSTVKNFVNRLATEWFLVIVAPPRSI